MAAYTNSLGLSGDAWDIYFLYGPHALWENTAPPKPDFWMHQLGFGLPAPFLDGEEFAKQALSRIERRTSP